MALLCSGASGPVDCLRARSLVHLGADAGCRLGSGFPSLWASPYGVSLWVSSNVVGSQGRALKPPESCRVTSAAFYVRSESLRLVHIEGREMSLPFDGRSGSTRAYGNHPCCYGPF